MSTGTELGTARLHRGEERREGAEDLHCWAFLSQSNNAMILFGILWALPEGEWDFTLISRPDTHKVGSRSRGDQSSFPSSSWSFWDSCTLVPFFFRNSIKIARAPASSCPALSRIHSPYLVLAVIKTLCKGNTRGGDKHWVKFTCHYIQASILHISSSSFPSWWAINLKTQRKMCQWKKTACLPSWADFSHTTWKERALQGCFQHTACTKQTPLNTL